MKFEPAIALTTAVIPEPYIASQEGARFLSISAKTLTRLAGKASSLLIQLEMGGAGGGDS